MSHVLGLEHFQRRFIAQTQNSRGNQWHSLEQIPQWWALCDWSDNHQEAKHRQERTRGQWRSVHDDISVRHAYIVRLTLCSITLFPRSCNISSKHQIFNKTRQAKICQTSPSTAKNLRHLRPSSCSHIYRDGRMWPHLLFGTQEPYKPYKPYNHID